MVNPIVEFRVTRGISRRDLAVMCGVNYSEVYASERGLVLRPHRRILHGLATLGYPEQTLLKDYQAYRRSSGEELLKKAE